MARKKQSGLPVQNAPVLWTTLNVKGANWPYLLSNDPKHFQNEGDEGCCDYEASCVYIASWLSPTQMPGVLIHELVHILIYTMGAGQLMQMLVDAKDHDDREERLVSLLAVDLYDTLQRNGLISIPKIPKLSPEALKKPAK